MSNATNIRPLASQNEGLDIYAYEDFRRYLSDLLQLFKKTNLKFSHRKLASLIGIANPGYMNDVIQARRAFSEKAILGSIKAFDLKPNEAEYFRLLVDYGQCKKPQEKQNLYDQMLFRRNRSSFVKLNPSASKYYQDWRYPIVRAVVEVSQFRGDYESLSSCIRPPLPVMEIRRCVRDLCEWGMLKQEGDGIYHVTHQFQEPPPSLSELNKRLNREWILQAANALDSIPKEDRHISSRLMTVSDDAALAIQKALNKFRDEVYHIVKADQNPTQVIQLNLQCIPRSHKRRARL